MSENVKTSQGFRLNADDTIQFEPVVNYAIMPVANGAIFQLNSAASKADLDAGRINSVQLHMGARDLRGFAEEILRIADAKGV